jgi:hypothetical protein
MKVVPVHSGLSAHGVPRCESRPPAGPYLLPGARASASERVLFRVWAHSPRENTPYRVQRVLWAVRRFWFAQGAAGGG